MNATCPMQSFEKDGNLGSIGSLYYVFTQWQKTSVDVGFFHQKHP